ncbi:MAG TPA: sugar phosphate isomerase/epimerase [Gemmatimonadaceae bacterium]|nr:sugar phosphate isomerase/epimerase [Gemmatimonadaceae bacterium]
MTDSDVNDSLDRRDFLLRASAGAALLAASPLLPLGAHASAQTGPQPPRASMKKPPIGIELYAVRNSLAKDLPGTLKAVRGYGYETVEFFAPYLAWTLPYAKTVRTMIDDLGLRCHSTHNGIGSLTPGDTMTKAIEINQILGTRHIVLASPPMQAGGADDWKRLAGQLAAASATLAPHGLMAGFHNHSIEWEKMADGQRPMDILAAGTPNEFVLQLDVGTAVKAGADPVAWINAHPGRIRSVHLKDWAPGEEKAEKSFRVLFGEGASPWKPIIRALESTGGVENYLMEQEGSRYSELDTARRCLANWKALRRSV